MKIAKIFIIFALCLVQVHVFAKENNVPTNWENSLSPSIDYRQDKQSKFLNVSLGGETTFFNKAGILSLSSNLDWTWDIDNDTKDFQFSTANYFVEGLSYVKNKRRITFGIAGAFSLTHILNYYTWLEPGLGLGLSLYWQDESSTIPDRKGSFILSIIPSLWYIKFSGPGSLSRQDENGQFEFVELNNELAGFVVRTMLIGSYKFDNNGIKLEGSLDIDIGIVYAGRLKASIAIPIFKKESFSVDLEFQYNLFKSSEPNKKNKLSMSDGTYWYEVSLAQENHHFAGGLVFNL